MKEIKIISKERQKKLFDLLESKKFKQQTRDNFIFFQKKDVMIVFPLKLQPKHLLVARTVLDLNSIMSKKTFHQKMELQQIGDKYYWNEK